jgi:hypothetical protein
MTNLPLSVAGKLLLIVASLAILATFAPDHSAAQSPAGAPAASAPKLTPEQRREFAALQESVMADAEYSAAVKRAIEAQKAADSLFFAKMLRVAKPEMQAYIKFLQQARLSAGSQSP